MREGHSRADVTCAMEREGKREMAKRRGGGERGVRFSTVRVRVLSESGARDEASKAGSGYGDGEERGRRWGGKRRRLCVGSGKGDGEEGGGGPGGGI